MVDIDSTNIEEYEILQHAADHSVDQAVASYWKEDRWLVLLLIITGLGVAAILVFGALALSGYLLPVVGLDFEPMGLMNEWLQTGNLIGIVLAGLGLFTLIMFLLTRRRARRNRSLYLAAGCPHCYEHDLVRIRRKRQDRLLALLGFPVRRYACRDCTWLGLRFHDDGRLELEKALAESMTVHEDQHSAADPADELTELATLSAQPPVDENPEVPHDLHAESFSSSSLISQEFMPLADRQNISQNLILPPAPETEEVESEFDFSSIVFDDVVDPVRQAEMDQFKIDLESMTLKDKEAPPDEKSSGDKKRD